MNICVYILYIFNSNTRMMLVRIHFESYTNNFWVVDIFLISPVVKRYRPLPSSITCKGIIELFSRWYSFLSNVSQPVWINYLTCFNMLTIHIWWNLTFFLTFLQGIYICQGVNSSISWMLKCIKQLQQIFFISNLLQCITIQRNQCDILSNFEKFCNSQKPTWHSLYWEQWFK